MLLLAAMAHADEAGPSTFLGPSPTFRLSVQVAAGEGEGPVWTWERVEVAPCVGTLKEAVRTGQDRRWTWLSERDGLHVGVCGEPGAYEVRLEAPRRGPRVRGVFLESGDQQLELTRERGRWTGDGTTTVSEPRDLTFRPDASARYREVRDELAEAVADAAAEAEAQAEEAEELAEQLDFLDWDDLFEDADDPFFDGPDWDAFQDGPDGLGGGSGFLGGF